MSAISKGLENTYYYAAMAAFACTVANDSKIPLLLPFGKELNSALILVELGLIVFGILCAVYVGELLASFLSMAALGSVWVYLWLYSVHYSQVFTPFAGSAYYGTATIALFVPLLRQGAINRICRGIYKIGLSYAVIYLLLWFFWTIGIFHFTSDSPIFREDKLRGARLVLSNPVIIYGLCYALARRFHGITKRNWLWIFLVCSGALLLAMTRTVVLIALLMSLAYFFYRRARRFQTPAFLIYASTCLVSFFLLYFLSWKNMTELRLLALASPDASFSVRVQSLSLAAAIAQDHWFIGGGIPSGDLKYYAATRSMLYWSGDLGMVGILVDLGVLGLLAYSLIVYFSCKSWRYALKLGSDITTSECFGLTGITLTVVSMIGPVYIGSNATCFGALFASMGLVVIRHRAKSLYR